MIENQYIMNYINHSKYTCMHDLKAIYDKVETIISTVSDDYFEFGGNHRFYPNPPKLTDLQVICLSVTSECCQIDSENLLWSKLKTDYSKMFEVLPHRTRFNARRKRLTTLLSECLSSLSDQISEVLADKELIVDSMPIPTCKMSRQHRSKACRRGDLDEIIAKKSYNVAMGGWYIGYKLHLITSKSGVYRDHMVTSANVHDIHYLKSIDRRDAHLRGQELLGDRGYLSGPVQLRLFEDLEVPLSIPYKSNQKDFKVYDYDKKIMRKTIETVFSQYCDEFKMKQNYAKRFEGFYTRIVTKLLAKTVKQKINLDSNKPINQTKHALAA